MVQDQTYSSHQLPLNKAEVDASPQAAHLEVEASVEPEEHKLSTQNEAEQMEPLLNTSKIKKEVGEETY